MSSGPLAAVSAAAAVSQAPLRPYVSPSTLRLSPRVLVRSAVLRDLLAIGILAAVTVAFFWPTIAAGLVYYENDTRIFYYPLFARLSEALKARALSLWSPNVFGGYPIFADGEAGPFYPLHLLTLLLLPVETAFSWLRPIRFFQGALFSYLFCRTLHVGRFGAIVGALSFAFSGFAVAQMHHTNINAAAVWLPLVLAFGELAVGARGRLRYLFVLFAGVAIGLQALVIHVQVVLMTATVFSLYCGSRCLFGPVGEGAGPLTFLQERLLRRTAVSPAETATPVWRRLAGRGLLAAGIVSLAGTFGGLLSAVQLLPLYEIGTFSFRGGGVDYRFASQYSLPPVQLISLLFPEFFMAGERYWGLWSHWEVFVYAGIAPLVLALIGLTASRNRLFLFFAVLGVMAIVFALGSYSPLGIHRTLTSLPGFSVLRAPGRFSLLFNFSVAMLAAFGADALYRAWSVPSHQAKTETGRSWRTLGIGAALVGVQLLAIAAPLALIFAGRYVEANKTTVVEWLKVTFVHERGFDTSWSLDQLYLALQASLDLAQPTTLRQLVLLAGTAAVLLAWERLRRVGIIWQTLLVSLLVVDVFAFGRQFHPTMSYEQLTAPSGLAQYVTAQAGNFRLFTQKGSRDEPNRLLPHSVAEANGYSSLEPDRHSHFALSAERSPSRLLDLMNVRYYAVQNRYVAQPSFNQTAFNPARPLVSSTGSNPAGTASYSLSGVKADRIRVISALRWATAVPQGTEVAQITATDTTGRQFRFALQAGVHTAEWAWERPDLRPKIAHQLPTVAHTWRQHDGRGQPYAGHFYYGEFPLGQTVQLRQAEVRITHPTAQVDIYGMAMSDDVEKDIEQLGIERSTKFAQVYSDKDMVLYENREWLPRAYLVPSAVIEKPGPEILTRMAQGDFSPERLVILEEPFDVGRLAPVAPAGGQSTPITFNTPSGTEISSGPGTVRLTLLEPERIRLDATAKQPAMLFLADQYYPGWKAYVDGKETKIYRANYLFRAVFVPAGQHTVEFVYQPRSFRFGLLITSAATLVLLLAMWLLAVGVPPTSRWFSKLGWTRQQDGDTMAASAFALASAAPASVEQTTSSLKGATIYGRQESESRGEEERPEVRYEGQEGQISSPPRA